jgi:hypothetical protein
MCDEDAMYLRVIAREVCKIGEIRCKSVGVGVIECNTIHVDILSSQACRGIHAEEG